MTRGRWYTPPPPSREEQYEAGLKSLPLPEFAKKYLIPGTIGEATGTATAAAALGLAPETGGLSLALPILGAAAGGYFEPSNEPYLSGKRFKRAGIEAGKELIGLGVGKALGKTAEVVGRFASHGGMLKRMEARIGRAIPELFNNYPFRAPTTGREMEQQIVNGKLVEETGERLGQFRDMLKKMIPKFRAGQAPQFIPASSGQPMAYSKAIRAAGLRFHMPDVNEAGERIFRDLDVEGAMDLVKRQQGQVYSASGRSKSGADIGLLKEAAHDGRQEIIDVLNKWGRNKPGVRNIGDRYANHSADYGTAVNLEDTFKNTMRTSTIAGKPRAVLDQGALTRRLRGDMPDLVRLQKDKAIKFQSAVSPTGAEAIPEGEWGHPRGSLAHSITHMIPKPYKPETRAVMPLIARALSSRPVQPLLAAPVTRSFVDPAIKPVVGPP